MNRAFGGRAITALELAIVTAVVALLTLVCLDIHLGRLLRKRVDTAQSNLRALAAAIDAYYDDNGLYPIPVEYLLTPQRPLLGAPGHSLLPSETAARYNLDAADDYGHYSIYAPGLWPLSLTTPMAYLFKLPADPFNPVGDRSYGYMISRSSDVYTYILVGCGPDGDRDLPVYDFGREATERRAPFGQDRHGFDRPIVAYCYDPTNGACSDGDMVHLWRSGRQSPRWILWSFGDPAESPAVQQTPWPRARRHHDGSIRPK